MVLPRGDEGARSPRSLKLAKSRRYVRPRGDRSTSAEESRRLSRRQASSINEQQPTPPNLIERQPVGFTPSPEDDRSHTYSGTPGPAPSRPPATHSPASGRGPVKSIAIPPLPDRSPTTSSDLPAASQNGTSALPSPVPQPAKETKRKSTNRPVKKGKRPVAKGGHPRKPPNPQRFDKTVAEIRRQKSSGEQLLRKAPFARLIREVAAQCGITRDWRFKVSAILALQEAAESYLVAIRHLLTDNGGLENQGTSEDADEI